MAALEHEGLASGVETAMRKIWREGQRPGGIQVRTSAYLRVSPKNPPPAVARLISAKSYALKFYLCTLFEAQCTYPSGARFRNSRPLWPTSKTEVGWVNLLAAPATANLEASTTPSDNRIRQLKGALRRLEREGLVELSAAAGKRNRCEGFMLLDEGGRSEFADQPRYLIPQHDSGALVLPIRFFTNLWIFVLTDSEIATYIALNHLRKTYPKEYAANGIYMTPTVRSSVFGLSRDAYEAHRALAAFGLVERQDHPARHPNGRIRNFRPGKIVDPYRFKVSDRALLARALNVVPNKLDLVGWV